MHRSSWLFLLGVVTLLGCAQGRRYVPRDGGADADADGSREAPPPGGDASDVGADASFDGSPDLGEQDGAAGEVNDARSDVGDAPIEHPLVDAPVESAGCPAGKPVLDNGVCCATGQRNCGGVCVACAAGSTCAGTSCACPATAQCAPAVPDGWLGPVAADLSGQNAACPATYPTSIAAGTNPQGAPATCGCTCGTCAGGACNVFYDRFSTSDCSGPPDDTQLIGSSINACNVATPNGSLYNIRGVASTSGASCGVTRTSVSAAPPTWVTSARLCSGATFTPGACTGDEVCAPSAAPKKTCIYHTGMVNCPAGYSVSSTQYTGFADSRDCTCACNPSGATCSPVVSFVDTTAGCTADTGTVFGQCGSVFLGSTHGFRINSINVVVTGATKSTASGAVSGASPITVCCTN